jgi:hypothetical protein
MITLNAFYSIARALADNKPVASQLAYVSSAHRAMRTQWEADCITVVNSITGELLERVKSGINLDVERQRFLDICGLNQSLPRG